MGGDKTIEFGLFLWEGGATYAVVQERVLRVVENPVARGGVGSEDSGGGEDGEVSGEFKIYEIEGS